MVKKNIKKKSTEQNSSASELDRKDKGPDGKFVAGNKANPNGIGGFQERPEDINAGGRPKNAESFAYWYGQFKNMTVNELNSWQQNNPEDTRTVASDLAFVRIVNAREDLKEFQEVANRSEGMPKNNLEVSGKDGQPLQLQVLAGTGFLYESTNTKYSGNAPMADGGVVSEPQEVQDIDMAQAGEKDNNSNQ